MMEDRKLNRGLIATDGKNDYITISCDINEEHIDAILMCVGHQKVGIKNE